MAEAIRLAANTQIAEWEKVARETPALADEAAQAIQLINQRAAAEIANLKDESGKRFEDLGRMVGGGLRSTLANAFRGVKQDWSDLLRSMAAEFAASGLIKAIGSAFAASAGAGPVASFVGGLFGGSRAAGGPVRPGRLYKVNDPGPELFVPEVPGRILSAAQTARVLSGGQGGPSVTVHVTNRFDVGLESVDDRIATTTPTIATSVTQSVLAALGRPRMA